MATPSDLEPTRYLSLLANTTTSSRPREERNSGPSSPPSMSKRSFSKIIVAVDGSEVSLRAADHAARIAKQDGAELLALHVVAVPPFEVQGEIAESYANARKDAKKWMKDVEDLAMRNGVGVKT